MGLAKEVLDALITSNVVKNTKRPMQLTMHPLSITVVCRVAAIPLCTPLPPVVITIFSRIDELVPGSRLNIKTVLSTYGDFHVKDKTADRTSYL